MKTVQINVYSFDELSEGAKQTALDEFRYSKNDNSYYFDEVITSVKKMADIFGLKFGRAYTDLRFSHIEDDILNLSGLRLQKYIYNNFYDELFAPKMFFLWSKKEKSLKYHKEDFPVLKRRYSKILKTNECVLTGVCYDMDILQPVYDFLSKPDKNITLEDLFRIIEHRIDNCFYNTKEWLNSDEFITEEINASNYEFTEDGKIY